MIRPLIYPGKSDSHHPTLEHVQLFHPLLETRNAKYIFVFVGARIGKRWNCTENVNITEVSVERRIFD